MIDNVPVLKKVGALLRLEGSASVPIIKKLGGQVRYSTSNLDANLVLSGNNTLYFVYLKWTGSALALEISTSVPSTYYVGTPMSTLVGAYYSGFSSTFGNLVNIQGTPECDLTEFSAENPSTWTTNTTHLKCFWARRGEVADIEWQINLTGSPSGTLIFNLPTGILMNSNKVPSGTQLLMGVGTVRHAGGGLNYPIFAEQGSTSTLQPRFMDDGAPGVQGAFSVTPTAPTASLGSGDQVNFRIEGLAISGWSCTPLVNL